LHDLDQGQRHMIGQLARETVLRHHTALHRAVELEQYYSQVTAHGCRATRFLRVE
jgi:hypothetical protein